MSDPGSRKGGPAGPQTAGPQTDDDSASGGNGANGGIGGASASGAGKKEAPPGAPGTPPEQAGQPGQPGQPGQTGSLRMVATLAAVAAMSGLLIVTVYQVTLPRIKANKARALREAVYQVVPQTKRIRTYVPREDGSLALLEGEDDKAVKFHAGYSEQGKLLGVALEAQGQGYQDVIKVLYGYDPVKEQIVGLKVLESKETPGLGDKIGKDPAFLSNFTALDVALAEDGKTLARKLVVVKNGKKTKPWEIDGITGATISSKAIGKILNDSAASRLATVRKQQEALTTE